MDDEDNFLMTRPNANLAKEIKNSHRWYVRRKYNVSWTDAEMILREWHQSLKDWLEKEIAYNKSIKDL
jgi:hypothetical protein